MELDKWAPYIYCEFKWEKYRARDELNAPSLTRN